MPQYKGHNYIEVDIGRLCDIRNCKNVASKRVNFVVLADYMAREVCETHIQTALELIEKHIPKDR